ncbi:MAG: UDP-2,3-diacylglucosamine diphosphatase LpxI [Acidobacteria bacterium]|nr:UDP-2,3-diacylglucosamine diphosphatase LpxI [Acidobacteriota bacterium]
MKQPEGDLPRYGLIAGSGQFPLLVLEAARSRGIQMVVAAIREEAAPELESRAGCFYWLGLGELSRLIQIFKEQGVSRAIMAGQVKHNRIFSSLRPDWKLLQLLMSLPQKNTNSLIGGVAKVLGDEGIVLEESTLFLEPLLAGEGVLTRRRPSADEKANLDYGRKVARELARWDIGQTVVVGNRACVAVEAMEGTDAAIRRAAELAQGKPLSVVKVAKPHQDMRFDVPVVGLPTIAVMKESGATALSVDAGKTLLFDREEMIERADQAGITIVGVLPSEPREPAPSRVEG